MSGGAYWRHGDPSSSDRVSWLSQYCRHLYDLRNGAIVGIHSGPRSSITLTTRQVSREDFNLTVGATLNWSPKDYLSVGMTASYVGNFSNASQRSYDVVTPSLIFGAQVEF